MRMRLDRHTLVSDRRDASERRGGPCAGRGAGGVAPRRDAGGSGAAPEDVFQAVTEEVARLLSRLRRTWPATSRRDVHVVGRAPRRRNSRSTRRQPLAPCREEHHRLVFETGRVVRMDSYDDATGRSPRASARRAARSGGRDADHRRGASCGASSASPRPCNSRFLRTPRRASPRSRAGGDGIAMPRSAPGSPGWPRSRRVAGVATLVARGTLAQEVFAAVANEVGRCFPPIWRTSAATSRRLAHLRRQRREPVSRRQPVALGDRRTSHARVGDGPGGRLDDYAEATGPLAEGIARGHPLASRRRSSSRAASGLDAAGSSEEQPLRRTPRAPRLVHGAGGDGDRQREARTEVARHGRGSWRRPTRSAGRVVGFARRRAAGALVTDVS